MYHWTLHVLDYMMFAMLPSEMYFFTKDCLLFRKKLNIFLNFLSAIFTKH